MPNKMRESLLSSTVLPSNKNSVPSQVQRVPSSNIALYFWSKTVVSTKIKNGFTNFFKAN